MPNALPPRDVVGSGLAASGCRRSPYPVQAARATLRSGQQRVNSRDTWGHGPDSGSPSGRQLPGGAGRVRLRRRRIRCADRCVPGRRGWMRRPGSVRGVPGGAGVRPVECSVHAQGSGQAAGPLASSMSFRAESRCLCALRHPRRSPRHGAGRHSPCPTDPRGSCSAF